MSIHKLEYSISQILIDKIQSYIDNEEFDQLLELALRLKSYEVLDFLTVSNKKNFSQFICNTINIIDPEVFLYLDIDLLNFAAEELGIDKTAEVISKLSSTDAIYIIDNLDDNIRENIYKLLPNDLKREAMMAMSYPEDSVGRLMYRNIITGYEFWDTNKLIQHFRSHKNNPENCDQIIIINDKKKPVGFVKHKDLIINMNSDKKIHQIMDKDIVDIIPELNKEELIHIFKKREINFANVISSVDGVILGVIYAQDIIGIIDDEAEQDILQLSGVQINDIHSGKIETFFRRFPWILLNAIMATCTSLTINMFDKTIQKFTILAAIMPLIASTGGNVGLQSFAVILRAISDREIKKFNLLRVILKELYNGIINGIFMASIAFLIMAYFINLKISIIFASSIIVIFSTASLLGAVVPMTLHWLKIDPYVSSSIILTTSTDIASYLVFLGLSSVFL